MRKLVMALLVITACGGLATLKYRADKERNEIAARKAQALEQQAQMDAQIAAGMSAQWGGESRNAKQVALITYVGDAINRTKEVRLSQTPIRFHLMAEPTALDLVALSNGHVYLTTALMNRMKTEGQLAAALAHGAAHVLANDGHTSITVAGHKSPLWQHSLEAERKADAKTVRLMSEAGYDPNAFGGMLRVLAKAHQDGADVTFFTSHQSYDDRLGAISKAVQSLYPSGVPAVLSK